MKYISEENYTFVIPEENTSNLFLNALNKEEQLIENQHLIIDFSVFKHTNNEDFLLFLPIATHKLENGTSFVIISEEIDIDDLPDELIIVPSKQEAIDIIEMDAISRDLEF